MRLEDADLSAQAAACRYSSVRRHLPLPTLVQFERNVVVLRGSIDDRPDQLTCDTLKLSLIPAEKTTPVDTAQVTAGSSDGASRSAEAGSNPKQAVEPDSGVQAIARTGESAVAGGDKQADADDLKPKSAPKPEVESNNGLLGGLTLQRANATGHAVWLLLPAQGVKLRCNELIHLRQADFTHKPDLTYFRGDRTRPLELEKLSVIEEEGPDKGKISSVTNIWTVDATMLDNGTGMDTADVVAHGPGRLETRPDRGQPVERIAIWQDKLILQNQLDAERPRRAEIRRPFGQPPLLHRQASRHDDRLGIPHQGHAQPKTIALPTEAKDDPSATIFAGNGGTGTLNLGTGGLARADQPTSPSATANTGSRDKKGGSADLAGGNLQIERLHAFRDVHLIAPAKTMTARERLDAEFIQTESPRVATSTLHQSCREGTSEG